MNPTHSTSPDDSLFGSEAPRISAGSPDAGAGSEETGADESSPPAPSPVLVLPADMDLAETCRLATDIQSMEGRERPRIVDGSRVVRVGTSGVQLILALAQDALAQDALVDDGQAERNTRGTHTEDAAFVLRSPSRAVIDALEGLGLTPDPAQWPQRD